MKLRKIALFILCLAIGFISCNKDDDGDDFTEVELRDRAEQQIVDNDSILGYLETHYYNSDHINSLKPNVNISDLVITKLADGETDAPAGHTMLKKGDDFAVEKHSVVFADTDYEFYILRLNDGGGDSPTFADDVRVRYEGIELNDEVFDSAVTPVDFDLAPNTPESVITGWGKVMPHFKTSLGDPIIENDGSVTYENHGVGVMFLPSGLGYFSASRGGLPAYSPMVFKFDLLQMKQNDHDNDGVPSYLEDLNGDGEFTVADPDDDSKTFDDTDGDGIPNYFDNDDDGDGILTTDEVKSKLEIKTYNEATKADIENLSFGDDEILITIIEELNGTFTGVTITSSDSDNDGIHDYLDAE